MSLRYQAVTWNRQKRRYDAAIGAGVALYLAAFVGVGFATHPQATPETLLIRGLATCAFVLLHVILSIGPLCRLDRRFLPLLYNRRHLGVTMFLVAMAHALFALVQFHGLGNVNPLVSVLTSNPRLGTIGQFPFELLGLAALAILFLMAATSHDFWLAQLTPRVWKSLHMLVYAAYVLVVLHVATGVLQAETNPLYVVTLGAGIVWLVGLHLVAAQRERAADAPRGDDRAAFVDVCAVTDIPPDRAHVACLGAERVAVFRHGDRLSAVSNVCAHQNGPLGEGRIVDGCITCPWHGYQYVPETGCSPPPFSERIATYRIRVVDGRVQVDARPLPPGTRVEPADLMPAAPAAPAATPASSAPTTPPAQAADRGEFYIGYQPHAPAALGRRIGRMATGLLGGAGVLGSLLAAAQGRFDDKVFEFQRFRSFEGTLVARPVPLLLVPRPGNADELPAVSSYLLVRQGKHGAAAEVAGFDGRHVRLEGALIYREDRAMIELTPRPIEALDGGPLTPEAGRGADGMSAGQDLGIRTLIGEIVDTKCFLGVMSPGSTKPHRACAARCISGGIPPGLLVRDAQGRAALLLLVGADGRSVNDRVLDLVAEPVQITGRVLRMDDLLVLMADPSTYRRMAS